MMLSFSPLPTLAVLVIYLTCTGNAFVFRSSESRFVARSQLDTSIYIFDKVGSFFEEIDSFLDDATSRRLGNGSKFYGKRKSSFYGADDKGKKKDRSVPDPLEDYQGPTSTGLFKWVPDETGMLRPVSRTRGKNLERSPSFWDKVYNQGNSDGE